MLCWMPMRVQCRLRFGFHLTSLGELFVSARTLSPVPIQIVRAPGTAIGVDERRRVAKIRLAASDEKSIVALDPVKTDSRDYPTGWSQAIARVSSVIVPRHGYRALPALRRARRRSVKRRTEVESRVLYRNSALSNASGRPYHRACAYE